MPSFERDRQGNNVYNIDKINEVSEVDKVDEVAEAKFWPTLGLTNSTRSTISLRP